MQGSLSKAERIKRLEHGKGLQCLLQEAYEILGNPILIHDMEYKAVAYNRNIVTDDPIWNAYTTKGTVDSGWLDFFRDECFIEEAANARTITFLISDKLKYDRVFGKLFNKNHFQVGCAVMVACDKAFECDDPALFEDVCAILSQELGRDAFFNAYGQAYFEKLIDELIAGVNDIALYAAHVESIYMHLKSNLYLAVVDIGKCDPTYTRLAYFRDLFKQAQPQYTYALYANYILIIIGIDEPALYAERDLSELEAIFHENHICAGISSAFENLFELNKYYRQALDALGSAPVGTNRHIALYDRLHGNGDA